MTAPCSNPEFHGNPFRYCACGWMEPATPDQPTSGAETCDCPPCPGRGNDGHGMTHCAECCFGSGVEVEPGCPVHNPHSPEPDGRTQDAPAVSGDGEDELESACLEGLIYTDYGEWKYRPSKGAAAVLDSDWFAQRLATARAEGAREVRERVETVIELLSTQVRYLYHEADSPREAGRVAGAIGLVRAALTQEPTS